MPVNPPVPAAGLKLYYESVNAHVLSLLQGSLSEDFRPTLTGRMAFVEIFYTERGGVQKISSTSDSDPDFAALLKEKIRWDSLASPAKFGLPNRAVKLRIDLDERGRFKLNLKLL